MSGFIGLSFYEFSENTEHSGADHGKAYDLETIAKRTEVHHRRALVLARETSKRGADDRHKQQGTPGTLPEPAACGRGGSDNVNHVLMRWG